MDGFQGTGEVIRDGKDYLLVFSKELADKAGLQEGDQVVITIEEGIKVKLTKLKDQE
jgi:bifunctional DNA-binding transcriptional regulator/antitoxin component of YhaV-PrlF toxin-antitoxin module